MTDFPSYADDKTYSVGQVFPVFTPVSAAKNSDMESDLLYTLKQMNTNIFTLTEKVAAIEIRLAKTEEYISVQKSVFRGLMK